MEALNEIANRARMLAGFAPESSKKLLNAMDGIALCQRHEDMIRLLDGERHAANAWRENCHKARDMMNELALLVYRHLPEFALQYVRVNPNWRFDDPETDWAAIVAELLAIEDAALRGLLASPRVCCLSITTGENPQVTLNGEAIVINERQSRLLELLMSENGEFVSLADNGFRTRDVQSLPKQLRNMIDSEPRTAGTRIPREKLYK